MRIADAVDLRQQLSVPNDGVGFHSVAAEDREVRGRAPDCGPAIQRIVIPMRDKNWNAAVGQPLDAAQESKLRPNTAVGGVVDIAGEHDEGGLALDRHPDQRVEGFERGIAQSAGDLGRDTADSGEWRIEMQIGRVHETELEALHACSYRMDDSYEL